jgi:hypothetical protein
MIQLYDAQTGAALGAITEEQLRFMMIQLEEESTEDRDYYINLATLDMLERRGADPELVSTLRQALGSREEMDVRWSAPQA